MSAQRVVFPDHYDDLAQEFLDAVAHYLDHDEYEMALEGLLIDLVAGGRIPVDVDWNEVIGIGKELHLDREPMFDPDAWGAFLVAGGKGGEPAA